MNSTNRPDPRHVKAEVAGLVRLNAATPDPQNPDITSDDRIASHPPSLYAPPAFLELTASHAMATEWGR